MTDVGERAIKLYQGGFVNRYPELVGLGGIAVATILLALDLRSAPGSWLFIGLLLAGGWFGLFRRTWGVVELKNEGIWLHRRFTGDLYEWSDVQDVVIGQDDQGQQQVRLQLAHQTVNLPQRLRIGRTELSAVEVQSRLRDFHERYGTHGLREL